MSDVDKRGSLLDILLHVEDFLDALDIYSYENWEDGEIVEGPSISKYWVRFTLMFDKDKMPDLKGGERLIHHGIKINYKDGKREDADFHLDFSSDDIGIISASGYNQSNLYGRQDLDPAWNRAPLPQKDVLFAEISVPRRFINEIFKGDMDAIVSDLNNKENHIEDKITNDSSDGSSPAPATRSRNSLGL